MSDATQDVAIERAEPDRPNNLLLFVSVAVTLTALVAVVIAVNELFKATFEREIATKVLEPPNSELRALRATEKQRLTQYQWVSEKDGVVRIPIDRAMALTLKDYQEGRVRAAAAPAAPKPEEAAQATDAAKPEEGAAQGDKDAAAKPEGGAAKPAGAAPKAEQPAKSEGEAPATPTTQAE